MRTATYIRLAAALMVAGILLTAGGCLLDRRSGFQGRVVLRDDAYAGLAVRTEPSSSPPRRVGPRIFRGAQARDLGLGAEYPSRVDAAVLPFVVRAAGAETVETRRVTHRLHTDQGPLTIEEGDTRTIGGRAWEVRYLRSWAGILHATGGAPRVSIDVRPPGGPWLERIVLESGETEVLTGGLWVSFTWSAAGAGPSSAEGRAPGAPRWGVTEGRATHWMTAFTPGAELTLRDGRELRLLEVQRKDGAVAAIRVGIIDGDQRYAVRVPANTSVLDGLIRLETPREADEHIVLTAGRPYKARATYIRSGEVTAQEALRTGDVWTPAGADWQLRLGDVLAESIVVSAADSPLGEAVLVNEKGERVALREGQREPEWPELGVYEREVEPALRRLTLEVLREDQPTPEVIELGPAGRVMLGGWVLTQELREAPPPGRHYLRAERRGGRLLSAAGGVCVLASLAALALPLLRPGAPPRPRAPEDGRRARS